MSIDHLSRVGRVVYKFKTARLRFYRYRTRAAFPQQLALAVGLAGLTGIAAQIRIPLPFTPVPITLQTFAVLLAGIFLGGHYGGLSQVIYVGVGMAGVPWFQGGGAGMGHLLGPTGGYLVGFVAAAAAIGYVVDRYHRVRRLRYLVSVLFVINFVVIYGFGLPWLFGWLTLVKGSTVTLSQLLTMGLVPFVPGDVVKLVAAALVGTAFTPAETHGPERERSA